MNWYWLDRFTLFESGKRAKAVKTITRAEGHLRDHFRFHPVAPGSLIIEGLAQTAGLMFNEATRFQKKIVLGKIPRLTFYDTEIVPGDVLEYEAEGTLIAEGALIFAHLGSDFASQKQFAEGDLEDLVRAYGMYEVGVDSEGNPLRDPATPAS